ncbi:hypothetical protein PS1_0055 [Aeromonas phage PS1]|uniref:Uncharacterized protein n=1 Tax=Aeromonas phage PS1 TaxID=2591406 RepID=A0A514TUW2_9CAUD|nr:hypothetical protein PQC64_gp208 [Aeromonas phage PS1]QDJ96814.1 hypothetical protein PS1_0055 [Aeromonas phage PS1]
MINVYFSELPKTLTEILGLKYDETMSYEERVQKRYDYIKQQYELDNKYEGWDYLEHIKGRALFNHFITFDYLISTKGRILTLFVRKNKYKVLTGDVGTEGYKRQALHLNNVVYKFTNHRAVGSTFVPKQNHYKESLNILEVNHKDSIKLNNNFFNLEWCTGKENVQHNHIERSDKNIYFNQNFEATVEIDCKYKGVKFKVFGAEGLNEIGLVANRVRKVLIGSTTVSFGCSWKIITQEEAEQLPDIPEFIKNKFLNDRNYMNHRIKPLKGTVVKDCKYQGLEFVIYGKQELRGFGFSQGGISKITSTGISHQGCLFEYISRDEAELLPRGLTKEQQKVIVIKRDATE